MYLPIRISRYYNFPSESKIYTFDSTTGAEKSIVIFPSDGSYKVSGQACGRNVHFDRTRPKIIWLRGSYARIFFSYFVACIFVSSNNEIFAQQPGGVSGTKLWYVTRADSPNTLADRSGNKGKDLTSGLTASNYRNINFSPATFFSGATVRMIKIENFDGNYITVVGIFYPGAQNSTAPIFFMNQDDLKNGTSYARVMEGGREKYKFGVDGERTTFRFNTPQTNATNAMKNGVFLFPWRKPNHTIWGENLDAEIGTSFKGYIPELVIYTHKLSKKDINKIQSYLSIKYGTTLDTSYTNSVGKTIWDINDGELRTYHNRLIAVGRDSVSGLFQKKSNSTYEDNGTSAYVQDADASVIGSQAKFIPTKDKPSSYRSLTVELSANDLAMFPDKNFLFFGDDGKTFQLKKISKTKFEVDLQRYQNLDIIDGRSWLVYNQNGLSDSVKMVVSGINFTEKRLFNTLYKAWDYQLYRIVLVRLIGNKIDALQLSSYFGREHFSDTHFNTRTLVWDNLTWNHNASKYHRFTFGRVPLLNFLQIGKSGKPLTSLERYPYERENPVSNVVRFDTLKNDFVFKLFEDKEIEFTVSPGVPPLTVNFYLVENGKLVKEISDPLRLNNINEGSINEIQVDADVQSLDTQSEEEDTDALSTGTLISLSRHMPVSKQLQWDHWPVKFVIKANKIERNKTYLIRVVDSLGQVTTLPFRTRSLNQ